jgi:hypothetical protein
MFGLMKRPPRLPYCGTCKTMGERYGQKTRLLLNNDTVFLAELLVACGGMAEWSPAYRSFNCMSMPKDADVPAALDFAAAATVVLAHFRIEDHRVDSGKRVWNIASRLLSPSYRKAAARLRDWQFPMDQLVHILSTQSEREADPQSLAHVAEPTAAATGLFFEHGSSVVGRQDLGEMMYRVGHRFGFLIYALDALEDRARDAKRGDFNPLLRLPDVDAKAEILAATADIEREIPAAFGLRLRANVEERLGMRPRVLVHRCRKTTWERWKEAVELTRSLRKKEGALAFGAACVVAFFVPHHMRSAESLHHGLGLGLNLMALGAVLSSAVPPPPPSPGPGGYQPNVAIPSGSSPVRSSSGCCGSCGTCGECCTCCDCSCCAADCCADGCCEACCSVGECCN